MTVLPAALVGIVKWRSIDPTYQPIVLYWALIAINESIRFYSISIGLYSMLGYNVYVLLSVYFYLWQFYNWGLFGRRLDWCIGIAAAMSCVWIIDHFIRPGTSIHMRQPYFRLIWAFVLTVLAVSQINQLIVTEKKTLISNPQFLICLAVAGYYTYRVLLDTFTLQGMSTVFLNKLSNFNRYLLQLMYLLFLFAAICIPKKKRFILPYSLQF